MNWQDALDYQADLFRFWGSPLGLRYGESFGRELDRKNDSPLLKDPEGNYDPDRIAHMGRWLAFKAEPVAVDGDVMAVIEAAIDSFQPEPLVPEDLLTNTGFVLLPRPHYIIDAKGRRVSTRAFAWAPVQTPDAKHSGVVIMMYTHVDDDDDYNTDEVRAAFSVTEMGTKLSLHHIETWWFNASVPSTSSDVESYLSEYYRDADPNELLRAQLAPLKIFQVLNRLANQRLMQRIQMMPQRQYRKRATRAGLNPEDPYITVITLRRPRTARDEDAEPSEVPWTHRWIVGGHWRNQWYPSLDMHRQIWIGDYVKGPEGKELVIRDKRAFNFVR